MHDGPGNQPGPHVAKGDELGYFQFGGSTYCLVLRPGVVSDIVTDAISGAHGSKSAADLGRLEAAAGKRVASLNYVACGLGESCMRALSRSSTGPDVSAGTTVMPPLAS